MKSLHRRIALLVVGLVAAFYTFSMVVVTGRDLGVSDDLYSSVRDGWMRPHLMQSWGLFAKGLVNSDKTIVMRAQIQDADGATTTTDWVDLGALELRGITHEATPTRAARTTYKIAGDLQIAVRGVPRTVRPAIALDYPEAGPLTVNDYLAALVESPEVNSAQRREIAEFVNLDNVATRLTTLYSYRFWDAPVVAVQWYVVISPVPRFEDRNIGLAPPPSTVAASGWRTAPELDPATIRAWMAK